MIIDEKLSMKIIFNDRESILNKVVSNWCSYQPTLTTQLYFEGDPYHTDLKYKSLILKGSNENETKKSQF